MKLYKVTIILFCALNFSSAAFAEQITGCHCFKNKQFDVEQPGAVDPYLLATTQNSFLAAVFGIDKKQIVLAKMRGGASGDDLWIAYFVASKTGSNVKKLLTFRKESVSWKKALEQNKIELKLLGAHFTESLSQDPADKGLSSIVVDQMIIDCLGVEKSEVKRMRKAGAQNKEIILSSFMYKHTKKLHPVFIHL